MIKLFGKILLYGVLVLIALEILVRIFHLYPEDPPRFIDELNVEKRVPGYTGYNVTGNRRQNFSQFRINKQGFNSYRDFYPSESRNELALIGDSFIQGFHEEYNQSIGKKIEQKVDGLEVYEYGYAGWDMADQLHLINAYKEDFEKIDRIVIYMDYPSDFHRATYEPNYKRIKLLNSTVFKLRNKIKLFYYTSEIGMLDAVKRFVSGKTKNTGNEVEEDMLHSKEKDEVRTYISNFDSLLTLYPIEKNKTSFLLDCRKTPEEFLTYCRENNIKIIDFGKLFEKSKVPVTLIYDQHWNTHGRSLVAESIVRSLYPHQEN